MFSVELEGIKYQFRFKYNQSRTKTVCAITAKKNDQIIPGPFRIKMGQIKFDAVGFGVAKLHPNDTFNKYIGLKIALKKALDRLYFSKVERSIIWDRYFEKVNGKVQ